MHMDELLRPTLARLAVVLPQYGEFTFDDTPESARSNIGSEPDLANPEQASRIRVWLNQWLCRIGYPKPGDEDVFVKSLAAWWEAFEDTLPPAHKALAQLTDWELEAVSQSYGDLYRRPAAVKRTGSIRTVGPTAAAKVLYFVRPDGITAWDRAISLRTGGGSDALAFWRHLKTCRSWAVDLEAEGRTLGLAPGAIGSYLNRPNSSVAKLIDEWLYGTITGGFGTGGS
jgi:hypothetical protein